MRLSGIGFFSSLEYVVAGGVDWRCTIFSVAGPRCRQSSKAGRLMRMLFAWRCYQYGLSLAHASDTLGRNAVEHPAFTVPRRTCARLAYASCIGRWCSEYLEASPCSWNSTASADAFLPYCAKPLLRLGDRQLAAGIRLNAWRASRIFRPAAEWVPWLS